MSKRTMEENAQLEIPELDEASAPYIGRWNRLVSTTNWEKGKIICQWRTAVQATGAPAGEYSDEAWSRRVGGISPQHAGRLRRVHQRFGDTWQQFEGLYWSHFCSALDWTDAEMWLEGAVQNTWSISQMCHQRWEAMGAPAKLKPRDEDIITAELDEDVALGLTQTEPATVSGRLDTVRDPDSDESFDPDFGDDSLSQQSVPADRDAVAEDQPRARPFAELKELPDDLAAAFEAFKLAILHHKMEGWSEVARDDVLATLDALKELTMAS